LLLERLLLRLYGVLVGALAHLLLERVLLTRQLQHLLNRLVELRGELLLPLADLLLTRIRELLRRALHGVGRLSRCALILLAALLLPVLALLTLLPTSLLLLLTALALALLRGRLLSLLL